MRNMKYFAFTLLNVVIINIFCLQNVAGRYILVKVGQQAIASSKAADGKISDLNT